MFLHLGENTVIPTQDVVAILDYDVVKKSSAMRRYMQNLREKGSVISVSDGEVKSIILTDKCTYLSSISVSTLKKRVKTLCEMNENI